MPSWPRGGGVPPFPSCGVTPLRRHAAAAAAPAIFWPTAFHTPWGACSSCTRVPTRPWRDHRAAGVSCMTPGTAVLYSPAQCSACGTLSVLVCSTKPYPREPRPSFLVSSLCSSLGRREQRCSSAWYWHRHRVPRLLYPVLRASAGSLWQYKARIEITSIRLRRFFSLPLCRDTSPFAASNHRAPPRAYLELAAAFVSAVPPLTPAAAPTVLNYTRASVWGEGVGLSPLRLYQPTAGLVIGSGR